MANTPNLNLVKPALDDDALITDINNNMDKIDTGFGSLSDHVAHVDTATTISSYDDIPVNSQGRVVLPAALRPDSNAATYNYQCYGSNTDKTLIFSNEYYTNEWITYKTSGSWKTLFSYRDQIGDIIKVKKITLSSLSAGSQRVLYPNDMPSDFASSKVITVAAYGGSVSNIRLTTPFSNGFFVSSTATEANVDFLVFYCPSITIP